ncbi:hypothetical protein FAIPA1_390019 [Frankia sp. AiPs1]
MPPGGLTQGRGAPGSSVSRMSKPAATISGGTRRGSLATATPTQGRCRVSAATPSAPGDAASTRTIGCSSRGLNDSGSTCSATRAASVSHLSRAAAVTGADNAPAGNASAGNAPVGNAPVGNAPAGDAPAGNAPAGDAPAGDAPAGNAPVGNAVAEGTVAGGVVPIPGAGEFTYTTLVLVAGGRRRWFVGSAAPAPCRAPSLNTDSQ